MAMVNITATGYTWPMPSVNPILNFVADPKLIERLDDFRFKNRFESRAAAVKWLLDWALKKDPKKPSEPPKILTK
jgi:hypothetical protein